MDYGIPLGHVINASDAPDAEWLLKKVRRARPKRAAYRQISLHTVCRGYISAIRNTIGAAFAAADEMRTKHAAGADWARARSLCIRRRNTPRRTIANGEGLRVRSRAARVHTVFALSWAASEQAAGLFSSTLRSTTAGGARCTGERDQRHARNSSSSSRVLSLQCTVEFFTENFDDDHWPKQKI